MAQIPTPQDVVPVEVFRFGPEEWLPLLQYYSAVVRSVLGGKTLCMHPCLRRA